MSAVTVRFGEPTRQRDTRGEARVLGGNMVNEGRGAALLWTVLALQLVASAGCSVSGASSSDDERRPGKGSGDRPAEPEPGALANVSGGALGLRCEADASTPQKTDYAKPGPFLVAQLDLTLEDRNRPIAKTDSHAASPSRRMATTIFYPASRPAPLFGDAPVAGGGPFPVLMYSHGFSSSRDEGATLGNLAASYGYIVVSPDFPLTNLLANNGNPDPTDGINQAGDVSFLLDELVDMSHDPEHVLFDAVDDTRVGATGVSGGGLTTLLVSFHPEVLDPRIKATAPIAPLASFFMEGFYHTRELPMLLVHGDIDAFLEYRRNARVAFERAQPNARLMTIAGGSHAAFAIGFDQTTIALMNALLGLPGSHPTNPDGFGCGAVGEKLRNSSSDFSTGFGGTESFIDTSDLGDSITPCSRDEYKEPAMDPREQVALTASAVLAFFEAHLAARPETRRDGCRYLLHEVPKHPAITLE